MNFYLNSTIAKELDIDLSDTDLSEAGLSDTSLGDVKLNDAKAKTFPSETAVEQGADSQPASVTIASIARMNAQELLATVHASGLFDKNFYNSTYEDIAATKTDALEHFLFHGYKEGRYPNQLFDPRWYVSTHLHAAEVDVNPLVHYILIGDKTGLNPSALFNSNWYRRHYAIPGEHNAFAHYLQNRTGPYSPIPEFDAEYYLKTYRDVAGAGADPFEHYIFQGFREDRNPSEAFDTRFYIQRYLKGSRDQNPLLHYLQHRHEGFLPQPAPDEATISSEVKRFTKPGPDFEEFRPSPGKQTPKAKVLAYYLTQFHTFPENEKWWGRGFTEWTNIARGQPRFKDHYQPRIPRDLGFYSLEDNETLKKQAELAKAAGIHGFVFYYYWFNKKRLMERPLEQFLANAQIDMPFCLMWANENWTRRWDGLEDEVLIAQDYSSGDDRLLVADFVRHFSDPRYIRLQGRPLLMIYRPQLIPNTAKTIERWRKLFFEVSDEQPLIFMSQSFNDYDPRAYGMDGAIEFPPHKLTNNTPLQNKDIHYLDDSFSGQVFSYDDIVEKSIAEPAPPFPMIKTAVPSWDNDARRQGRGLVLQGSTPAKYERWLSQLIDAAQKAPVFGEKIVCVNAWNEWCEGAYLEPDLHYGSAYLNATSRAVSGLSFSVPRPRLLLIGHDAFPSGAQFLLLNLGRTLRSAFGLEIEFLLMNGGELEADYGRIAPVTVCHSASMLASKLQERLEHGFANAIVNTAAAGTAASLAVQHGYHVVFLVHELPRILKEKQLETAARQAIEDAQHTIFPATYNRDQIIAALAPASDHRSLLVRPQGTYKKLTFASDAAAAFRQELGIRPEDRLILGVGYADMRKGFDLFIQLWRNLRQSPFKTHFCWAGNIDPFMQQWLAAEIADAEATGTFHMCGFSKDVERLFSAADGFALTSREDPFPTVVLEALSLGVPVFAFDHTGGIPAFLKEHGIGHVAPYCDILTMAKHIAARLSRGMMEDHRANARNLIERHFSFPVYTRDLLHYAMPRLASVSVVVPNYNYAHCLPERLSSIFNQTHPVEEIIVLDDASSDDSIAVIETTADSHERDVSLIINETNSGSVFAQWMKGAAACSGEFIWIAEADDLSEPDFLSSALSIMAENPSVQLCFCDSRSIDQEGAEVYPSYKGYYDTVEPGALRRTEVFDGGEFVQRFLSIKNVILNVSAVVWRRKALLEALAACETDLARLRMAGDWRLYLECLLKPDALAGYVADTLNIHRRHAQSVTHSLDAEKHVNEIRDMHNVVVSRCQMNEPTIILQTRYANEIAVQLSAGEIKAPALQDPLTFLRSIQRTG